MMSCWYDNEQLCYFSINYPLPHHLSKYYMSAVADPKRGTGEGQGGGTGVRDGGGNLYVLHTMPPKSSTGLSKHWTDMPVDPVCRYAPSISIS